MRSGRTRARTLTQRLGAAAGSLNTRVISFVLAALKPQTRDTVSPRFVFWGRLTPLKRVDRAIYFFAAVARKHNDPNFMIIGPDDGRLAALKAQADSLKLVNTISFRGALPMEEIAQESGSACFYLQLSDQEGMAMSVVEVRCSPTCSPMWVGAACRR